MRVDDALGFARLIAAGPGRAGGLGARRWRAARRSFVTLPRPIPVRLLYHTACVEGGRIVFAPDAYGWDEDVAEALGLPGAPAPRRAARRRATSAPDGARSGRASVPERDGRWASTGRKPLESITDGRCGRCSPSLCLLAPGAGRRAASAMRTCSAAGAAARRTRAATGRPQEREPLAHFYGDRIEIVPEGDGFAWDVSGEIGNGPHRLWLATAGDGDFRDGVGYVAAQVLYSHPILEAGPRRSRPGVQRDFLAPRRTWAVVGMQGNVSEPLYVGAFAYFSTRSELTGSLYAYYDWEPVRG